MRVEILFCHHSHGVLGYTWVHTHKTRVGQFFLFIASLLTNQKEDYLNFRKIIYLGNYDEEMDTKFFLFSALSKSFCKDMDKLSRTLLKKKSCQFIIDYSTKQQLVANHSSTVEPDQPTFHSITMDLSLLRHLNDISSYKMTCFKTPIKI